MSSSRPATDDAPDGEELNRRTFFAHAAVAAGGLIGLGLAVPLLTAFAPPAEAAREPWATLTRAEVDALDAATASGPTKLTFTHREINGYLGEEYARHFFWAVRTSPEKLAAERPELDVAGVLPFPVVNFGFTAFSPICPHLGCGYAWNAAAARFVCPCHGSRYTVLGKHESGPALRGLDPLPLRRFRGRVQVTWIEYKTNTPRLFVQNVG